MEFHLHLYFSVYPIMHQLGKEEVRRGKNCLKEYLETMLVANEIDSWGNGQMLLGGGGDKAGGGSNTLPQPSTLSPPPDILMFASSPTLRSLTASSSSFMRSKEFAIYAGLVMVPEPQSNEAFSQLFKHDWMSSMRSRFLQFIEIVGFGAIVAAGAEEITTEENRAINTITMTASSITTPTAAVATPTSAAAT